MWAPGRPHGNPARTGEGGSSVTALRPQEDVPVRVCRQCPARVLGQGVVRHPATIAGGSPHHEMTWPPSHTAVGDRLVPVHAARHVGAEHVKGFSGQVPLPSSRGRGGGAGERPRRSALGSGSGPRRPRQSPRGLAILGTACHYAVPTQPGRPSRPRSTGSSRRRRSASPRQPARATTPTRRCAHTGDGP